MNIEQLTSLPYSKREQLHAALSEVVEKVLGDRDGQRINRTEKALTRFMVQQHNKRATTANRNAIASITGNAEAPFTRRDMNRLLSALETGFEGIAEDIDERLRRDLDEIYRTGKVRFVRQFDAQAQRNIEQRLSKSVEVQKMVAHVQKINELGVGIDFGIVDEATITQLANLARTAIGTHFPRTLRDRVVKSIEKNVFERGLNKQQAGEALKAELTRINGGNAFASVPESIRRQGMAGVNAYYEGLSATNVTLARNFANVQAMDEAGIIQIQFVAVIDDRTSTICLQMHGRIFEIDQAKQFRQRVLDAEDTEDLKDFAAWRKDLSDFGLSAGQNLNSPAIASQLAQAGVIVPPLHFRCRSELHPA